MAYLGFSPTQRVYGRNSYTVTNGDGPSTTGILPFAVYPESILIVNGAFYYPGDDYNIDPNTYICTLTTPCAVGSNILIINLALFTFSGAALTNGDSNSRFKVSNAVNTNEAINLGQANAMWGNYNGSAQYNAGTVLTAADVGRLTVIGGSGGPITLPLVSSIHAGGKIYIISEGGTSTVAAQSTDVIYVPGVEGGTVTSIPVTGSDWIELTSHVGSWLVTGGPVLLGLSSTFGKVPQVVTGIRACTTVYRNTSGRQMIVAVSMSSSMTSNFSAYVDSLVWQTSASVPAGWLVNFLMVVPAGKTYQVGIGAGSPTINVWTEL